MLKFFKNYKFIFDNISPKNRRDLYLLSFFTFLSFCIEIIQLSSLRLFIQLIQSKTETYEGPSNSVNLIFFNENSIFTIGICFFILLVLCTISRIFIIKFSYKTASNISCDISNLIFNRIIKSPYFWQLKNSDSFSLALITKDSENLMYLLQNIFTFFSHFFLIVLILSVLIIVNPSISLSLVIPVSGVYLIIYFISRKKLIFEGKKNIKSTQEILKISLNSLTGIKNLIIDNSFNYFLRKYSKKVNENRSSNAKLQFTYQYPKVLIEFTVILTLTIIIFFNYDRLYEYENYWSELITITFGIFRLIIPLQIFYVSYSKLGEYKESVTRTKEFYNKDLITHQNLNYDNKIKLLEDKNKILELRNVSFSYPSTDKAALKKINFEAYKGETIAIVGKSGSGKSTFMDMLMGLIVPTQGRIYFNADKAIGSKQILRKWQKNISFVPQKVFIIEDTVASNIALGIPKDQINFSKVKWAAEKVKLSKIILNLPGKYNEFLLRDEKSNFSGGEAQKLGIARGLYRNRKILFFDEISSSLDQSSENQIISLIRSLNKETTKFIISHNINKIDYVDRIVVFKNGTIDAIDSYDNLLKNNETFKKLKEESFLKNKVKELDN